MKAATFIDDKKLYQKYNSAEKNTCVALSNSNLYNFVKLTINIDVLKYDVDKHCGTKIVL